MNCSDPTRWCARHALRRWNIRSVIPLRSIRTISFVGTQRSGASNRSEKKKSVSGKSGDKQHGKCRRNECTRLAAWYTHEWENLKNKFRCRRQLADFYCVQPFSGTDECAFDFWSDFFFFHGICVEDNAPRKHKVIIIQKLRCCRIQPKSAMHFKEVAHCSTMTYRTHSGPTMLTHKRRNRSYFIFIGGPFAAFFLFCHSHLSSHRIEDKRSSSKRWRCTQFCRLFNQFERYVVQLVAQKPTPKPEFRMKCHLRNEKKNDSHVHCAVANRKKKILMNGTAWIIIIINIFKCTKWKMHSHRTHMPCGVRAIFNFHCAALWIHFLPKKKTHLILMEKSNTCNGWQRR